MNKKLFTMVSVLLSASVFPLFAGKTLVQDFDNGATKLPDGSFAIKGGFHSFSKKIVPVNDLTKETIISVELKAAADADKSVLYYVGMTNHDTDGSRIFISYVYPEKGSDTVLAAPCKKTDTVLKVKDASKFKKGALIAYNTKKDLSDLPNKTVNERAVIKNIVKKGNIWEVTLANPCKVDHPANTPIRAHYHGWYQYLACGIRLTPGADWTRFTYKIAGSAPGNPSKKWTLGTKGVKFIIFNNGKRTGKNTLFFRNLTIITPGK